MERFRNQVAIVTGASAGIGAAVCKLLVEEGLKVIGVARRVERIEQLATQLANKPGKLYARKVDLRNEAEIVELFKWSVANVGPVHVLINNAGLVSSATLLDGDTAVWRNVFDVNVLCLCICTREATKIMREHKIDGHIVNVNSLAGHRPLPKMALNVYGASKYAVTNLCEAVRGEIAKNNCKIKVSSVSPGPVATEIFGNFGKEFQDEVKNFAMLQAQDIANAVKTVLNTPPTVEIQELIINPVGQVYD